MDPEAADKMHFLGKFCFGNRHGGYGSVKIEADSRYVMFLMLRWFLVGNRRGGYAFVKLETVSIYVMLPK